LLSTKGKLYGLVRREPKKTSVIYNILRNKYMKVLIENSYLKRRITQLKKRINILSKGGNTHSFKYLK